MTPSAHALLSPAPVLDQIRDPFSKRTEALREVRQGLLLRADPDLCSVIAIVSPGASEGRSRFAAEMAWLLAQLGQSTLLVDANLRKPAQQLMFSGAGQVRGLADALIEGQEAPIHPVQGAAQLFVTLAGSPPKHPVELLSGSGFAAQMSQWRSQFRHIVLDTAAFTASSDALAVAVEAGAALLLVRENHSDYSDLKSTADRLKAARVQMLGSLVQGF